MPISFISAGAAQTAFASTIELPPPAGIQDGDLLVSVGGCADNVATQIDETGWVEQANPLSGTGADSSILVSTKVASSESGDYTFKTTGATSEGLRGFIVAYRGVDQSTPMDAAATEAANQANSDTHDPAAITTVTANAFVVSILAAVQGTDANATQPSGYTLRGESGNNELYVGCADIDAGATGEEDPGTWSGLNSTADHGSVTIALRPATAGGLPGFHGANRGIMRGVARGVG